MQYNITQLEKNLDVFTGLLNNVETDIIKWKSTSEAWCLLEVVCHLYDEERDDFRFRTQWVLEKPGQPAPTFNQLDWIEERQYMQQDYNHMVKGFLSERKKSVAWLKNLENPNWDHAFEHSKFGTMSAAYFLTNWVAHDYLHIRQILKLKFNYLKHRSGSSLDYAGKW